jgi:hypothetical protein
MRFVRFGKTSLKISELGFDGIPIISRCLTASRDFSISCFYHALRSVIIERRSDLKYGT